MELIRSISEMRKASASWRAAGKIIGFVPTMGFLHEGHLSLMRACVERCDITVVSIFVNPTQFGPNEDFAEYPRDLERDLDLSRRVGVDLVYHPDGSEMYPEGFQTFVEVTELSQGLCGESRPGHFRGVATVVAKLFNQVDPHVAFFGQKDYQQLAVIRRMVRDLDMDIEIVGCPIKREPDGLAMSSRNVYLDPEERKAALCLYRAIVHTRERVAEGVRDTGVLLREVEDLIRSEPLARIDYVAVRDPDSLAPLEKIEGGAVLLLAVWVGRTRLIDNCLLP